jgi:hypothetical protein
VYQQIISDLTIALSKLPGENEWKANKYSAHGLLARVYLQMGQYDKATDAANTVITESSHSLLSDYSSVFNRSSNSSEDLFAIQVSSQDGVNNMVTFFSIPEFGGRDGDIVILADHLALYDANDARLALFYEGNGATRSGKWNNRFGIVNTMRLAEMYLIRAEGNLRSGTTKGANPVNDYNAIRQRAGLAAVNTVALSDVLLERRRELAHEGFIIHDIKRLKGNVGSLPYDANVLVFPIPNRELEANPNMVQNEGY